MSASRRHRAVDAACARAHCAARARMSARGATFARWWAALPAALSAALPTWALFAALWCGLALTAAPAAAQNRAYLDRDRLPLDETLTMTIETEDVTMGPPDFGEFLRDFRIVDLKTDQQINMSGARMMIRISMILRLQPTREGVIDIPPFRIGQQTVGPFRVTVTPPRNAPTAPPPPSQNDVSALAMVQTSIEPGPAYVQQAVGYVVRLYYEPTRLIDGTLDQPAPTGAALVRVGDDIESRRNIDGTLYRVIERRFLVIPERPGALRIPPPVFEGRSLVSMFDEMFGAAGGRSTLKVAGDARSLQVLPIPGNAPQPWFPARGVTLRYLAAERSPRVGEAAKVIVEMTVDGANAVMLPELQIAADGPAQVFPEPPQVDETFFEDRPRTTMVREFSVVPQSTGSVRIAGPRVVWWDVKAGVARTASLPDFLWQVAPAANASATAPAADSGNPLSGDDAEEESDGPLTRLIGDHAGLAAIGILAVLWIATAIWAWRIWKAPQRARSAAAAAAVPVARGYDAFAYKRLIENGSLGEIADALCAMATPATKDLDRLRALLDDPAQRAAIDALQRARWHDGAVADARARLRAAFADGPRWRAARRGDAPSMLPPLYPGT